jgi:UDP-N-acetyl-D-galactosamine dehydrogenase
MKSKKNIIGVIGMGYVGLPLAVAFGKKQKVVGFDINDKRIKELANGYDNTNEINLKNLKNLKNLNFSKNIDDLKKCNIYIVTVPTPVDIYESTVFPGATEEICGPILENNSGLKINKDIFLGYSPERINPGDKKRQLANIVKIVSGSNNKTQNQVFKLYSSIIKAGVYRAESIKIAEAAKVIENTQRDLNIAFINELSLIFKKMNLSTEKILKAAETKWNFLSFRPGLVGGHCIGVDPYYLTYKSKKIGYKPKIILSGRALNDQMSMNVFKNINDILINKNKIGRTKKKKKILIMGLTFKENCPDTRNSKVLDLFRIFKKKNFDVSSFDPYYKNWDKSFIKKYNVIDNIYSKKFDVVLLAVKHNYFNRIKNKITNLTNNSGFIYDLKYMLPENPKIYRL